MVSSSDALWLLTKMVLIALVFRGVFATPTSALTYGSSTAGLNGMDHFSPTWVRNAELDDD